MGGETTNKAKIAEKLSDELFSAFIWERVGTTNISWQCESPETHKADSHPSDVVFFYDEPYSPSRTYVQCDLKSYAKGSISSTAVRQAVESLARQVACAEKSDEWRKHFVHDHVTPEVCGLLFVYNHDGGYDKDFDAVRASVRADKLDLPKNSKLVVLGPKDIFWLDNVRYEITKMRGTAGPNRLPDPEHCQYFYPQLARKVNVQLERARAATLEMLTSPWIVLEYRRPKDDKKGVVVFYRRDGSTTQEFVYLLDYLRHFQVINGETDVTIKTLDTVPTAQASYQKGVQQYLETMESNGSSNDFAELVQNIKYEKITQVVSTFSEIELGMDYV